MGYDELNQLFLIITTKAILLAQACDRRMEWFLYANTAIRDRCMDVHREPAPNARVSATAASEAFRARK